MAADALGGVITAPDKQRSGIYGVAQQMASCLINPEVNRWVTPPADPHAPEFDPHAFVRTGGTLYSLSREGRDSAGPLVTALTVAVVEAAEEYATTQPGGRLSLPLVGVLDEAANVCRWRTLPALYSHYGSRGIVLMTILQSWAQGIEVWGERGMEKLWSAANVRVYGGGVSDTRFLGDLSELAGEFELRDYQTSRESETGGWAGARTVSESVRRDGCCRSPTSARCPRAAPSSPPVRVRSWSRPSRGGRGPTRARCGRRCASTTPVRADRIPPFSGKRTWRVRKGRLKGVPFGLHRAAVRAVAHSLSSSA
ncbi:TraG/TraD/VirD4 family protein [Streptomyces sp. NPDC047028]|uniref:type IV secretory system conjugative DNA transfer family protein n=1 Tax=Streptomyces sp. NPDC047028 TaxID=3155793 RepID=UPI0033C4CD3D